uniref:Uncharacterized protein n=1 Tax=Anopheles maculatus TaxID=74869 RepID=A0A182TCG0_9DIPT
MMPTPLYLIHSPRSVRSDTEQNLPTCDANQEEEDLQHTQAFKNWLLSRLKLPTGHGIQSTKVNQINAHDNNELQAILTQPAEAEVCLLSDSPYRILRLVLPDGRRTLGAIKHLSLGSLPSVLVWSAIVSDVVR